MPRILSTQIGISDEWARELGEELYRRVGDELTAIAKAEKERLEAGPGGAADPAGGELKLQAQ